jgi:molybdenum cofactor biosynthesis protein B
MSEKEHKKNAPQVVRVKVVTISDTRQKETDTSGQTIIKILEENGHEVIDYEIVKDEIAEIESAVLSGCNNSNIDVVLTNGGTGIAKRDVTIEVIQSLIEKQLVGFGELFRMLSYTEDIGSAAILSRAIAGVRNETVIFSTPGSTGAVKLAMNKLIIPEITHVVREAIRK